MNEFTDEEWEDAAKLQQECDNYISMQEALERVKGKKQRRLK